MNETNMNTEQNQIILNISGIGIVFYSPVFAETIPEGADYLSSHYTTEQQVQSHIQNGTIVGFGTGTPGVFILKIHEGYPDENLVLGCDFKLRLGLHCSGGLVCFRDLYDLMNWHADCPSNCQIELDDGFYHVTLCSNLPSSGILGDNQEILMYFHILQEFPRLAKKGIPSLCF